MKILSIIASANPIGGGPIEGVRRLSLCFRQNRFEHEIVTLDLPDAPFLKEFDIPVHALGHHVLQSHHWRKKIPFLRYGYTPKLIPWLKENLKNYDLAIVNGLWNYASFGAAQVLSRSKTPYLVFSHGMLDPWFRQTYPKKHLFKQLFWLLGEGRLIHNAQSLLFTTEDEKILARGQFWGYDYKEKVVGYGTADVTGDPNAQIAAFYQAYPHLRHRRFLLYLSRIHPKKGADLLIPAFAKIAASHPDLDLMIAGPHFETWTDDILKPLVAESGLEDRIFWPGMLSGEIKWGAFRAAEAFVLPSHQENFGIVVAEALACETPVLITDKVNIWHEVKAEGCGLVEADHQNGINRLLQAWLTLTPEERLQMKAACRPCFLRHFNIDTTSQNLVNFAKEIIERRK